MQNQNNPYIAWPSLLKDESGGTSSILPPLYDPNVAPVGDIVDLHTRQIAQLQQKFQRGGEEITVESLPNLILQKPIHPRLSYDEEGEQFIVDHTELDVYGVGSDEWGAIKDFRSTLEDAYYNLKKDHENLGPRLYEQWQYFQQIIKEP